MEGFFHLEKKRQRKSTRFLKGLPDFSTLCKREKTNNKQNETKSDLGIRGCASVITLVPFFNPISSFFLVASSQEVPK